MKNTEKSENGKNQISKMGSSYYVAECSEFHSLGREYRNLTLTEAVEKYRAVSKKVNYLIPELGIEIEDEQDTLYSGCDCELVVGGCIQCDVIALVPYFARHPFVIQSVEKLKELMPELEIIGSI